MPEPKLNREDYKKTEQEKQEAQGKKSEFMDDLSTHLDELRNRILITVAFTLIAIMASFYYSAPIMQLMQTAAPEGSSFFQLKPGELFMASLKVAVFVGLSLSMPVLIKQVELFLKPGLSALEHKVLSPLANLAPLLFYAGVSFAFYLVLPPLLEFLLGFRPDVVETRYGLEHFINLEISILTICGLCFQLPVIMISLGHFGLVTSGVLLKIWRYVVLGAFVLSAIITPTPDPLTMSILAFALLALYFITILVLKLYNK